MKQNYVFKLVPALKDNLWGGTKLKEKYGKSSSLPIVAEAWELSLHKDGISTDESGTPLSEIISSDTVGQNAAEFPFFPVLIKFIDAKQDLSVQVHPSDSYALTNEHSFGKTEMWYIVEADEGAVIYLGFNRDVTEEEYKAAIADGTVLNLLNAFRVKSGEYYFIPSGTVHAIGKGCLIAEVQQNSNLTYRVYDYMRRDANGNLRELHVDKALRVSNLSRYERSDVNISNGNGRIIALSKYFTVTELVVNGEKGIVCDGRTFKSVSCVKGNGKIDGKRIVAGDSYFVSAGDLNIKLEGNMTLIMTEVRKYYVGIDLGGTFIKGGIVDDLGNIIVSDKVPTEVEGGQMRIAENISNLANSLMKKAGLSPDDVLGLGMGVPGMIDSAAGVVMYSNNLGFDKFPLAEEVSKRTSLKVKIANDANVATLGEVKFGVANGKTDAIMLTLGTGVGGGIVANGQLIEGYKSVGAELGHVVIIKDGEPCSCGRRGCLEAYASATALIRQTKKAMAEHKDSKMWEIGSLDKVTGKTAFDYQSIDKYADGVVKAYIDALSTGITNYINIFRPQVVILGGGVCAQGDNLINPIRENVKKEVYAGELGPKTDIVVATLGNNAGVLGAVSLFL